MQTTEIDSTVSTDDFLIARERFITSQIDVYKSELAFIKQIRLARKDPYTFIDDVTSGDKQDKANAKEPMPVIGATMPGFGVINQKTVRPHVEDFLRNNRGKHTTAEIFSALQKKLNIPQNFRKAFVGSISLSLHGFVTLSTPKVKKTETDDPNAKAYEWVRASIALNDD